MNFTTGNPTSIFLRQSRLLLFQQKGYLDIRILPSQFLYPMDIANSAHTSQKLVAAATTTQTKSLTDTTTPSTSTTHPQLPQQPLTLPHPAAPENIPQLKQYLLDQFDNTTFNCSTLFPVMSTKPAHIHLKEGAAPLAQHTPILEPLWKAYDIAALNHNGAKGIITPVTIGTPTT